MAESNMEAAANALFSSTSELRITSVKANSASDDLHKIVAVMIEHAIGANAALSSFIHISRNHTALTSECGSMLEEVLAITEGLEDVYILGKEATTAHGALMADLSKAHSIIFPLEASLSADLAAVADKSLKDKENNKEISLVHGQSLYQTYIFRLREAYQSLSPLVLSLTNYVKELHSTLTKLARVSNLHAGNLHKALEGLGESQISRSQNLAISGSEPSNNVILLNENGGLLESSGEIVENLVTNGGFLHDEGWISAPDHTYTSSQSSSIILSGSSTFEKSNHVELCFRSTTTGEDTSISVSDKITEGFETISVDSENQESKYISQDVAIGLSSITPSDLGESIQTLSLSTKTVLENLGTSSEIGKGKSEVVKDLMDDNEHYSKLVNVGGEILVDSSCPGVANHKTMGKNAYALTVLKQIELKIDGESIDDRSSEVSEQVDYLIKQATNIDNLCNMYEGWTPWI